MRGSTQMQVPEYGLVLPGLGGPARVLIMPGDNMSTASVPPMLFLTIDYQTLFMIAFTIQVSPTSIMANSPL